MKYLFLVLLLISSYSFGEDGYSKKSLKEFTSLNLKIFPNKTTKIIFPFILDSDYLQPRLKVINSNGKGFSVNDGSGDIEKHINGQNSISILGLQNNGNYIMKGVLSISVGGYNLSINLETASMESEHINNIVYSIPSDDREHLISIELDRRLSDMEKSYQRKIDELSETAREMSLEYVAELSLIESSVELYNSSQEINLNDTHILSYIDSLVYYNDSYFLLEFEIDNPNRKVIRMNDYRVSGSNDDVHYDIQGRYNCPKTIASDTVVKCIFVTTDERTLSSTKLKISYDTDRGLGVHEW